VPGLALSLQRRIQAFAGVRACSASSVTGRVLVEYDSTLDAAGVLALAREQLESARTSPPPPPAQSVPGSWGPLGGGNPFLSYLRSKPQHAELVQSAVATAFVDRLFEAAPQAMISAGVDVLARGSESLIAGLGFETLSSQLGFLGVAGAAVWLLDSFFGYLHTTTSERLALAVQDDLRNEVYRHLQQLDLAVIERRPVSDWMSILDNDISRIGKFISLGVDPIITIVANAIIVFTTFFMFSPALAAVHLALAPVIWLISRSMLSRIMQRYEAMRESEMRLSAVLHGNVAGMATIASFTRQEYEAERVARAGEEWSQSMKRVTDLSALYTPTIQVSVGAGFLSTLIWGAILVYRGEVTPGAYNSMGSASLRLLAALGRLGMTSEQYQRANVSMMRVIKTLQRRPTVAGGAEQLTEEAARGNIVVDNVRFGYNPDTLVLKGVSLVIPGGKTTALVGPTGAGKTTILKLLLRFYDAGSGSVRIGGSDIRDLDLNSLRGNIALVPQTTFLFGGTIRENIAYANPQASDEEVRRAARIAGADTFIEELPQGYDTLLTERALQLSGGQQQRIAIARAVLSNRSILLFDEATSAIDFETEAAIQHSLREAARDRTIVLVAHRLSTVRNADVIYVLEDGRVLEKGRHEDLLLANGLYAALWRIQTGEMAPADEQGPAEPKAAISGFEYRRSDARADDAPAALVRTEQEPEAPTVEEPAARTFEERLVSSEIEEPSGPSIEERPAAAPVEEAAPRAVQKQPDVRPGKSAAKKRSAPRPSQKKRPGNSSTQ
jgi:ATP-binding cassette subfamily B protein